MQSLAPGVQLTDNLLLTEELPVPPGATYRVWFALNVQLGKIVTIKIFADGHIQAIDNGSNVKKSVSNLDHSESDSFVTADSRKGIKTPVQSSTGPKSAEDSNTGRNQKFKAKKNDLIRPENILLVVGFASLILLAFVYRKPLIDTARSSFKRLQSISSNDTGSTVSDHSMTEITADSAAIVSLNLLPSSTSTISSPTVSSRQAARLLNSLGRVPIEKHPAIFVDAQRAFTMLRQQPGNQSYIDSLYTVYTDRGAQSIIIHQQNGDPMSKRYAIYWYRTACVLRPDPSLQNRIRRLLNDDNQPIKTKRSVPTKKSQKSAHPLFMADPEVN